MKVVDGIVASVIRNYTLALLCVDMHDYTALLNRQLTCAKRDVALDTREAEEW